MTEKPIEVEIRSFISKEQYEKLIEFFQKEGQFINQDEQETHYFDCDEDLRIQKNKFYSKIWMKKGMIHDDQREEIEVKLPTDDFIKLEKLFLSLGYKVGIKWFRTRHSFKWDEIDVAVDYTKGYGYILELEKMSSEEEKEQTLQLLRQKLTELGILETPKEEFKEKYQFYKENWRKLV